MQASAPTTPPAQDPALCGIILHPAGHTLSPLLHRTAYESLSIQAVYLAFDVTPAALEGAVAGMRSLGIRQLSVSLPHKERALALADRVSPEAARIGAANTLTWQGGILTADNTDWLGVRQSLLPLGPWSGRRATVLGAGGAARAVVYALQDLGLEVRIVNRSAERAERLARDLGARVGRLTDPCDLLVNATPVGMTPDVDSSPIASAQLDPATTVFDTVYRPLRTRLLREAAERGCRTQDGLDMLVHQAVEQVRIWTGRAPDPERLRQAAEKAAES